MGALPLSHFNDYAREYIRSHQVVHMADLAGTCYRSVPNMTLNCEPPAHEAGFMLTPPMLMNS